MTFTQSVYTLIFGDLYHFNFEEVGGIFLYVRSLKVDMY